MTFSPAGQARRRRSELAQARRPRRAPLFEQEQGLTPRRQKIPPRWKAACGLRARRKQLARPLRVHRRKTAASDASRLAQPASAHLRQSGRPQLLAYYALCLIAPKRCRDLGLLRGFRSVSRGDLAGDQAQRSQKKRHLFANSPTFLREERENLSGDQAPCYSKTASPQNLPREPWPRFLPRSWPRSVSLRAVTGTAGGDEVVHRVCPALRPRHDVIGCGRVPVAVTAGVVVTAQDCSAQPLPAPAVASGRGRTGAPVHLLVPRWASFRSVSRIRASSLSKRCCISAALHLGTGAAVRWVERYSARFQPTGRPPIDSM
jgi:hypothetical protein